MDAFLGIATLSLAAVGIIVMLAAWLVPAARFKTWAENLLIRLHFRKPPPEEPIGIEVWSNDPFERIRNWKRRGS